MQLLQNTIPTHAIQINNVGISAYRKPIQYKGKFSQNTIASCSLTSSLAEQQRGTRMSILVEILETHLYTIQTAWSLYTTVRKVQDLLESSTVQASIATSLSFPMYSPVTKLPAQSVYDVTFRGTLQNNTFIPHIEIVIPLFTVCPCSLNNTAFGAHSQRVYMTLCLNSDALYNIEDALESSRTIASSIVYPLVKQLDEKHIIEHAFNNPYFIEDVVRNMASSLQSTQSIYGFTITAQSLESIHPHNAYASIEQNYWYEHALPQENI